MKKFLLAFLVFAAGYATTVAFDKFSNTAPASSQAPSSATDSTLADAYANQRSNVQVQGTGVVEKVLKDDNDGSRHQRIIVQLASGQTVLIAHNIDLAPRIDSLREGDQIGFSGEYEWNNKGGVIHWTHRDPAHRHVDGWLEHRGQRYQ